MKHNLIQPIPLILIATFIWQATIPPTQWDGLSGDRSKIRNGDRSEFNFENVPEILRPRAAEERDTLYLHKNIIRVSREELGASDELDLLHKDALARISEIARTNPTDMPNYNPDDVWFVDTKSRAWRLIIPRQPEMIIDGFCGIVSDGPGFRPVIMIDKELGYYRSVLVGVHEGLHVRFKPGEAITYKTNPKESFLRQILEEATVEERTIALVVGAAQHDKRLKEEMLASLPLLKRPLARISRGFFQHEIEKTIPYPMERLFKNIVCEVFGEMVRNDIDVFLEKGDSSKLKSYLGEFVWEAMLDLTVVTASPLVEAGVRYFIDYGNPPYALCITIMSYAVKSLSEKESHELIQQKVEMCKGVIKATYVASKLIADRIRPLLAPKGFDGPRVIYKAGMQSVEEIFKIGGAEGLLSLDTREKYIGYLLTELKRETGWPLAAYYSATGVKPQVHTDRVALEAI